MRGKEIYHLISVPNYSKSHYFVIQSEHLYAQCKGANSELDVKVSSGDKDWILRSYFEYQEDGQLNNRKMDNHTGFFFLFF